MVVIHVKKSDGDGFLFSTTTSTQNDNLIRSLVTIHNQRLRGRVVIDAARGLSEYGPMKKVGDAGLDEIRETYQSTDGKIEKGDYYKADPTGLRTGNGPGPKLAETLQRVVKDLEEYIDKCQVQRRVALTEKEMEDKFSNVRGAVIMAYPMGLPEWDTVKIVLDDSTEGLKGTSVGNDLLDPLTSSLWVAGKEFQRSKLVSDRLGKNEKTKVIAKLQPVDGGPPAREPMVNEEERKAMMAHYFKRQEDLKSLAVSEEDDYLDSKWADPKGMKKGLQGLDNIKAPGLRF